MVPTSGKRPVSGPPISPPRHRKDCDQTYNLSLYVPWEKSFLVSFQLCPVVAYPVKEEKGKHFKRRTYLDKSGPLLSFGV